MTLLRDLDAFYTEHQRCGDVRGGVEERDNGAVVGFECDCTARITRPVPPDDYGLTGYRRGATLT